MKKLMLLDGNSLVYRAFHALSEADMRIQMAILQEQFMAS